jgi:hypothetical protein
MCFEILGPAGDDPEIRASVARLRERYRNAADTLFERLLVEGLEENVSVEDIERLCMTEKLPDNRSPAFIRKIVIELLICLRQK